MSVTDYKYRWRDILAIAILCVLHILSVQSFFLSLFLFLVEYAIIYFLMLSGKPEKSFLFYIVFLTVSMELDAFIYPDGQSSFTRYSLFNPSIIGYFTPLIIYAVLYSKYGGCQSSSKDINRFVKWIKMLLVVGLISITLGMVLDDNGILSSGEYPLLIVPDLLGFLSLIAIFFSAIIILGKTKLGLLLTETCKNTIVGVSIAAIISMSLGLNGYYGNEEIMLAPMFAGFAPCILLFINKNEKSNNVILITIFVILFLLALNLPAVTGSKWYIILAVCLLYVIYSFSPNTNPIWFLALGVLFIYLIPTVSVLVADIFSTNTYNSWKFEQVVKAFDFTSYGSFEQWFMSQDPSAQFRIDEPINIAIEYSEKPWFALLGKGIAGTTQHHTILCDWSAAAAFSEVQSRNGFFYNMHESTAVIFLRHGILGIFFMIYMIIQMLRGIKHTPFAIIGLLWFVFYWSYGISFRLGAVALVIALYSLNSPLKEKV